MVATLARPANGIDVYDNARVLAEVLGLSEHLPRRPLDRLEAPVFTRLATH